MVAYPENPIQAEFIRIIREGSQPILTGKFMPDWVKNDYTPPSPVPSYPKDFSTHNLQGNEINWVVGYPGYGIENWISDEKKKNSNNILIVSAPVRISDLKDQFFKSYPNQSEAIRMFTYFQWVTNAPDNRGHNTPMLLTFPLPEVSANKFLDLIKNDPSVLDKTFMDLFGHVIRKGIKRVKVDGIKLLDMEKNPKSGLDGQHERWGIAHTYDSWPLLNFSSPIGESDNPR